MLRLVELLSGGEKRGSVELRLESDCLQLLDPLLLLLGGDFKVVRLLEPFCKLVFLRTLLGQCCLVDTCDGAASLTSDRAVGREDAEFLRLSREKVCLLLGMYRPEVTELRQVKLAPEVIIVRLRFQNPAGALPAIVACGRVVG